MTRTYRSGLNHQPAAFDRPRSDAIFKKRKYKTILEEVPEKRLKTIQTFDNVKPPQGYGYVRYGYPEFSEWCKAQCLERHLDVYIVSEKPKNSIGYDQNSISAHVHRKGYHFPDHIIEAAADRFDVFYDRRTGRVKIKDLVYRHVENGQKQANERMDPYEYLSGKIREVFPKIPDADLDKIIKHAFREGTVRVGNADDLPLPRRAQLAVGAHIRHVYTSYDRLLRRGVPRLAARKRVEPDTLAKIMEWRGEGEERSELREVVVIDDEVPNDDDERDSSVEFLAIRPAPRKGESDASPHDSDNQLNTVERMPMTAGDRLPQAIDRDGRRYNLVPILEPQPHRHAFNQLETLSRLGIWDQDMALPSVERESTAPMVLARRPPDVCRPTSPDLIYATSRYPQAQSSTSYDPRNVGQASKRLKATHDISHSQPRAIPTQMVSYGYSQNVPPRPAIHAQLAPQPVEYSQPVHGGYTYGGSTITSSLWPSGTGVSRSYGVPQQSYVPAHRGPLQGYNLVPMSTNLPLLDTRHLTNSGHLPPPPNPGHNTNPGHLL